MFLSRILWPAEKTRVRIYHAALREDVGTEKPEAATLSEAFIHSLLMDEVQKIFFPISADNHHLWHHTFEITGHMIQKHTHWLDSMWPAYMLRLWGWHHNMGGCQCCPLASIWMQLWYEFENHWFSEKLTFDLFRSPGFKVVQSPIIFTNLRLQSAGSLHGEVHR